jgi:YD repeat-containing protein
MKHCLHRIYGMISVFVVLSLLLSSVAAEAWSRPPVSPESVYGPELLRLSAPNAPIIAETSTLTPTVFLPLVAQNYVSPAPIEAIIEPGIGGQIGSPDGKVRVFFRPEAVTQTVVARYTPIAAPALPPDHLGVAGPAFELSAHTLDGVPVNYFPYLVTIIPGPPDVAIVTPTLTIEVRYTPEDIWGLDTRELFLYTRDDPNDDWQRAPSANYSEEQMVKAETERLGQFVPMAPLSARLAAWAAASADVKRLALDVDDDLAHAYWPEVGEVRETPLSFQLTQETRQRFMDNQCHVEILVTRDSPQQAYVPRDQRAQLAREFGADMLATLTFNSLDGSPWGWEGDGGLWVWPRSGNADDAALADAFVAEIRTYTGRPSKEGGAHAILPYAEFRDVAPVYAHVETLFLDHNYDWPVIDTQFGLIVDASYTALAQRLADMGLTCGEDNQPPPLPAPPSAEVLQRLRDLGYQNYQRYGADPVSFSTGNHVVQVRLFRIPGRGGLDFDFTFTYNSQDGRDDLAGYGWSWPYNARAQHYSDDSVSIVLYDGRTYHYTWNGSGYDAPAGVHDKLDKIDNGWRWTARDETILTFQETVGGFGILTEWRDRKGNGLHLSYDLSGQDDWENGDPVPRPPLTEIRDDAGRVVGVESDADGHVTRLDVFDGRTYHFGYADGHLTSVSNGKGQSRRFEYDSRHRMTKEWDPANILFLQSTYDDRDRVIEQVDASGI